MLYFVRCCFSWCGSFLYAAVLLFWKTLVGVDVLNLLSLRSDNSSLLVIPATWILSEMENVCILE
jgi:hypothetical protein